MLPNPKNPIFIAIPSSDFPYEFMGGGVPRSSAILRVFVQENPVAWIAKRKRMRKDEVVRLSSTELLREVRGARRWPDIVVHRQGPSLS
jgi:hypothetical protein